MRQTKKPTSSRPSGRPRKGPTRKSPARRKRAYCLVVNYAECWNNIEETTKLADRMKRRLRRAGWDCYLETADDWDGFEKQVAGAIRKRPYAVVVFGGDGSVRMAGNRIHRAKRLMGIVPCGQFNNIFHSLYGHTDPELALSIIKEGYQTKIDTGLANGTFFLGHLISGVVPAMLEKMGDKTLPKMAMTWGKIAGKASDDTIPRTSTIKVDTYTIESQPLMLNVHLLSRLMTLDMAPVAAPDDGRIVLVYDKDGTREMISKYVKELKKDKYQYNEGIQMIRGHRINISPIEGRTWQIDSEPVEFTGNELTIEVQHKALRVFANASKKK
ncbi:MAG: hypothetical protein KAR42_03290 [candidate division Zixibacteria bacterium]|nr:hypothetical protein [candidate division Zixibacteria bacterium]